MHAYFLSQNPSHDVNALVRTSVDSLIVAPSQINAPLTQHLSGKLLVWHPYNSIGVRMLGFS